VKKLSAIDATEGYTAGNIAERQVTPVMYTVTPRPHNRDSRRVVFHFRNRVYIRARPAIQRVWRARPPSTQANYKGAGAALTDVISGEIESSVAGLSLSSVLVRFNLRYRYCREVLEGAGVHADGEMACV
jgi:hypothetical protein